MSDPTAPLTKAELIELDTDWETVVNQERRTVVQFNPESLKVTFANQIVPPAGPGSQAGPAAMQFVGAGTTKLALQLWFDVSGQAPDAADAVVDVRELTKRVAYFITPKPKGKQFIPPVVRFLWGSFHFDGIMESLDESLEFFSHDGVPLRASMSFGLSQQKIQAFSGRQGSGDALGAGGVPGTQPLAASRQGDTVQGLVGRAGGGGDWKAVAAVNGIENPRLLAPGTLINLNAVAGNDRRR